MHAEVAIVRKLKTLSNISWLKSRKLNRLAHALTVSRVEKRGIIFDDGNAVESAHILLAGVARITCTNRKGDRTLVVMVAPGIIPTFPPAFGGIDYSFRCEAVSDCQIGTVARATFIQIAVGISSADFQHLASIYSSPWDWVQLRNSNFMGCTLEERVALVLLELSEIFGVSDTQGVRFTVARQADIAQLAGASRPRVTEHLATFERNHLIVRDGRQMIVRRDLVESFLRGGSKLESVASAAT